GRAPLFSGRLAGRTELPRCRDEEGWLSGDLHIENFGAFVAEAAGRQPAGPTFDLNDFDDAIIGPLRLDVLRLSTSLLLAARELGANGGQAPGVGRRPPPPRGAAPQQGDGRAPPAG